MASATIQNIEPDAQHDERRDRVIAEYETILRKVKITKELADQANQVRTCQFMKNWRAKMEEEKTRKARECFDPMFKPKEFPEVQSRVLAIGDVIRELYEYADETKHAFENAWKGKAAHEGQWSLYMPQFRELENEILGDIGPVNIAPAPVPEATVEQVELAPAVAFNIRIKPLGDEKAEKKWRKNMEKAGYVRGADSPEGWWNYTAPDTPESEKVFTAALADYDAHKESGDCLIVAAWEDDPAQLEIPVEDARQPGLCVIVTTPLDDEHDRDLTGILTGLGFNYADTNKEGEEEWTAPYAPDLKAAMDKIEDVRIIERLVR